MTFSFTWSWYNTSGSTWTSFSAGNLIGFYGITTYGTKVRVNNYNVGMHLRTSLGSDIDACAANHMTGIQYASVNTCQINGGGVVALNTVTQQQSVRITFTDGATSVATEGGIFYAYDGSIDSSAPTGVTAQGAERLDDNWTACGGSGSAVTLSDHTTAITHYYYVIMSASPTTVGEKTAFAWKISIDYY